MHASGAIDLQELIDEQPLSLFHFRILALCFLVLAIDGFDTSAIGFLAPAMAAEWGVVRSALAPVLTAALIGLSVGALIGGPLADRIGRKRVIVGSVLVFGAGSLASGFSTSLDSLTILRFVTGLGLGAAMPNSTTLVAEYMPARRRSFLVTLMFCGFTLGAATGGFIAAFMIPNFGWRSVLLLGGALPLTLAIALVLLLPESAKFLLVRNRPASQIRRALAGIGAASLRGIDQFTLFEVSSAAVQRFPVRALLSVEWRLRTWLLWLTYFCGLTIIFLSTSWLPTLLNSAGYSISSAAAVTAAFQFGGTIGALLVGWLMDRFHPPTVLACSYALAACCVFAVGRSAHEMALLALVICAAGFFTSGAQTSINAFAASVYPTELRATGVSWMSGIGRLGAIFGAFIGGPLLAAGWEFDAIFSALAAFGAVAALSIYALGYGRVDLACR